MTSTNVFTGMQGERNSSRVLRPPGGGQSDVLGVKSAPQELPKKAALKPSIIEQPKVQNVSNEKPKVETASIVNAAPRSRIPPGGFSSGGFW